MININELKEPPQEDYSDLTFGDRLRAIRKARGLTLSELSSKSGILLNRLGEYERGQVAPTITRLEWLCKALNVSASDLLGF